MARVTIFFGIVLILLGVLTYMATGSKAPTSLIPAGFGILLVLFGYLGRTTDLKKRALWMHIAVTIGLLGFLATIVRGPVSFIKWISGVQYPRPLAIQESTAMCVLLLVYVVLCVRSFIAARRARTAGVAV
jgi:hypothetical protein